jgi:hypothetical protein
MVNIRAKLEKKTETIFFTAPKSPTQKGFNNVKKTKDRNFHTWVWASLSSTFYACSQPDSRKPLCTAAVAGGHIFTSR